ncbi:MAG: SIMPL domain-containing protein [Gammaproteobacteria bacterium]|jgi:predicted secreted protein
MERRWQLFLILILLGGMVTPCGAADSADYNQVEFSVQAEMELPNDLAEAVLTAQVENADPSRAAAEINKTMAWALNLVRGDDDITANSGAYQTYPVYDKTRLDHWRAVQTLVLRSKRIESLNGLVGKLQQRLQVRNMRFTVSSEQRRTGDTQLIDQALERFKTRALRIQERLGAKGYKIVNLKVDTSGSPVPIPVERLAVARIESAAPVASEAGTSRRTVTVHAVIQMRF